jgi:hypothetical protein
VTDVLKFCVDCRAHFISTAGEQAFFADAGLQPPRRCKPCRAEKKRRNAERDPSA